MRSALASIATALPWLFAFTVAEWLTSYPTLAPTIPHTVLRLVSFPLALFALALIVRPAREALVYAAIFIGVSLLRESGTPHLSFSIARILIEAAEMGLIVWLLYRHFFHRLRDPLILAAWAVVVLAIAALAALAISLSAAGLGLASTSNLPALGGSLTVAWRYWWLANACTFFTLAGPVATLVVLRERLVVLLTTPGSHRRRFFGVVAGLVLSLLFGFPVFDMSWRGFAPDLLLALQLLPVPFAVALAARYRANGAAIATLLFTFFAVVSVTGPAHNANWQAVPLPATPTQTLLLVTASSCTVIAGISRQLKIALNEAVAASQAKSRFIATLNHELRTPLNAILGFSELMRLHNMRAIGDALAPVENIHASGQRLLAMIEGLLDQADRGASVFQLDKQPLRVADAVGAIQSELVGEMDKFGCAFVVDAADDLMIEADSRAFRQMLLVLINYALRFVGAGTSISVSAAHLGTDTIVEVACLGLINAADDDRDKVELQLVNALALAHGARLTLLDSNRSGRIARLTFFATRAAA